MKLISHRGNINGCNPNKENHPDYIKNALTCGYDVEIDVWHINDKWYLGHDEPQYEIEYKFLTQQNLWLHAKNANSFYNLLHDSSCHTFWHTDEDWVLTSNKIIWTFPNKKLFPNSVCVLPEKG